MGLESKLGLPRVTTGLDKSLNQSPQGNLEKIGYTSSNRLPRNCCKVSSKYLIGHVLGWQNGGSTTVRHASMKTEFDNPDTSAMVVWQRSTQNWQDQSKTKHPKTNPNIDKSTFKCTHCNKIGHTKSRCFEIVGYPDWWDHNRDQWKKDSKKTSTATLPK